MSNEQCSPEALAQAHKHLLDSLVEPVKGMSGWKDVAVRERATVIELRRENDKLLEEWHTALAELATERRVLECAKAMLADMEEDRNTERQRLEESESDRRTQYCRADAAERLLATERQRAEAAEAEVERMGERAGKLIDNHRASEAKRKALLEALVKYGSHRSGCSVSMRGTEDEGCTCGFYRLTCDDDLSADGKDTPPEETSMRGVRDDSEHYT